MPRNPARQDPPKTKRSLFGRRKAADGGPKKTGRVKQLWAFYRQTSKIDKTIPWWTLGTFLLVWAIGIGIGFAVGHPVYMTVLFLPLAFMTALIIMSRRGEKAAYAQIAEKQGASIVALRGLRKRWHFEETPVAVDARSKDIIFRVVGPSGIVLIGDGNPNRIKTMLANEERKTRRVASTVPIHLVQAGPREGQISVDKLARHIMKLKNPSGLLQKNEIAEVQRRMRALGGMTAPIPKGVDPSKARMDRRAMRGR